MFSPNGLRILAVDDEPGVLEILTACLKSSGHVIDTCPNAPAALQRFVARGYDLVLTDRAMPGMDGLEFAAEIKRISPGTPVIMMTGLVGTAWADDEWAIDAILRKPFTLADLRHAVESVIQSGNKVPSASGVFN